MTIHFTEQEKEWIDIIPFNWSIKDNCPDNVRETLEKKLSLLYKQKEGG